MSKVRYLLFLLISFPVLAEDLDVIEVKSEKDVEQFSFADSTTITSDELEKTATPLASDVLNKTPGVVVSQNGGPGSRTSFFMRGTESRHVAFTLDGLKINDTSNVDRQFDAAFISSPFLKEVIVHRGPQAVMYGSDAMGGIIEFVSRKGDEAPETRLLVNGGSFGTIDATLSSDWKNKYNRGTLTMTRFHTDGISRLNEKRFHAKEKDSTDITQVTSSSSHQLGEKIVTNLLASYNHGNAEQDQFGIDTKSDRSLSDQYILQQKTSYSIGKAQSVSLRNGLSRHQRFIKSEGYATESYSGNLYQNEALFKTDQGPLKLVSGIANEHETNHSDAIDGKSFDLNSLFVQSAYEKEGTKFQAGGRADHHSRYGQFMTGSAGIGHQFESQLISMQYSQGFKAPSLYQLYGPPAFGYPVGNSSLVPERNHSLEASWKLKKDFSETGITLFQNRLSNLITFSNSGYLNQGRFIAEGIELFGKYQFDHFVVMPSFTHQNFRDEKKPVLRRPYNMAQVNASYFPVESIELYASGRWYSSREDLDQNNNQVKLNGFFVLDVGIRKSWEKDDVGLQVKNLLDREYEELYGYSVLPFSIFAHYGHRF